MSEDTKKQELYAIRVHTDATKIKKKTDGFEIGEVVYTQTYECGTVVRLAFHQVFIKVGDKTYGFQPNHLSKEPWPEG